MTPVRTPHKKDPKYLDDITYTLEDSLPGAQGDLFGSVMFLGLYDEKQVMEKLRKAGIIEILHKKGYRDFIIRLSRHDNYTSRLYLDSVVDGEEVRLIEVILREGVFRPRKTFVPGFDFQEGLSMLLVEWLALQDPKASFSPSRPRLPGQAFPGLGGLKIMQGLLYEFGKAAGKDAIIDIPEFYHTAVIYSRLYSEIYSRAYSFFSPVDGGQLQAMIRDLGGFSLADVSFAVTFDCLLNARTGEPAEWKPSEQIYPISGRLHSYFGRKEYREILEKTTEELSFTMDWEKYKRLSDQGIIDEV